jgi:hypothetical protein
MSIIRSAARRLGLGKYKYYKGSDLEGALSSSPSPDENELTLTSSQLSQLETGNNFFEQPHPEFSGEQNFPTEHCVERRGQTSQGKLNFSHSPPFFTAQTSGGRTSATSSTARPST